MSNSDNIDKATVDSFGTEWSEFSQDSLNELEHNQMFQSYFGIFPWDALPKKAEGFDMGCGSGRWAKLVAERVFKLNCVDPSAAALEVARKNLSDMSNVNFLNNGVSDCVLLDESQDFGYSLGVLHYIPDTEEAMASCTRLLKPAAPFLVYLYFRFDNKPKWYAWLWSASNLVRKLVSKAPEKTKLLITNFIAAFIYYPLARAALLGKKLGLRLGKKLGLRVENWPLSSYRANSFYTMRTDSRDRFGTPLEHRFTRIEITKMMENCDLENITFSPNFPFWCMVGYKKTK